MLNPDDKIKEIEAAIASAITHFLNEKDPGKKNEVKLIVDNFHLLNNLLDLANNCKKANRG